MPTPRLPFAITGMILLALAGLHFVSHGIWLPLVFGLAVLAVYLVPMRLESELSSWMLRFVLFLLVLFSTLLGSAPPLDGLINPRWMNLIGFLCAAELLVQTWSRRPAPALLLLLPCFMFWAASNTYNGQRLPVLAPAFMLCTTLGLAHYRPRGWARPRIARVLAAALVLGAIGLGWLGNAVVMVNRDGINAWGERLFNPLMSATGITFDPLLGATYGMRGSPRRVLRLTGYHGIAYLRGMAFDTYDHGRWRPALTERQLVPLSPAEAHPTAPGSRVRISEFSHLDGILFLPAEAVGMQVDSPVQWAPQLGGPMRIDGRELLNYEAILPLQRTQALWPMPDATQQKALLQVPDEITPRVRRLAQRIGGMHPTASRKIDAVINYLTTHHAYSLTTQPGAGDPVSNFLLEHKNAHCEYFGSAATILLRSLGVPTRYVVGYLAYESDLGNSIIVRQRDAHAWAESWVPGTGWVTVDATPGDGRPDHADEDRPPWWMRLGEALQDSVHRARDWAAGLSPAQMALLVVAVVAPYFLLQFWQARRQRARAAADAGDYTAPDRSLSALAARFTAWLQRKGIPCPPALPWRAHLEQCDAHPTARAFVQTYSAARFGAIDRDTLAALDSMLGELEHEPASPHRPSPHDEERQHNIITDQ